MHPVRSMQCREAVDAAHHVKGTSSKPTAKVQHTIPWAQIKRLDKLPCGSWTSGACIALTKDLLVTK